MFEKLSRENTKELAKPRFPKLSRKIQEEIFKTETDKISQTVITNYS